MCGIVGYIGNKIVSELLITGLKRLEYRGYDSSGVAILEKGKICTIKKKGKVAEMEALVDHSKFNSTIGIAHTRWATHGEPNDINAHPHSDNSGNIALVHNGIIENYAALKTKLSQKGYTFKTETDSEVLAVFIGALYDQFKDLEKAVRLALTEIDGTFGILVLSSYEPDKIIAARRGSPMVFGIGDNEYIVASDASAIIQHTRQVIYLSDNEMAIITRDGFTTKTIHNQITENIVHEVEFDLSQIAKGGYDYFMLKEIHEQPMTLQNAYPWPSFSQ